MRALSRYRELGADRGAALLTGRPSALARALQKISGEMAAIPTRDLRQMEPVSSFAFAPALAGKLQSRVSCGRVFHLVPAEQANPQFQRRLAGLTLHLRRQHLADCRAVGRA